MKADLAQTLNIKVFILRLSPPWPTLFGSWVGEVTQALM